MSKAPTRGPRMANAPIMPPPAPKYKTGQTTGSDGDSADEPRVSFMTFPELYSHAFAFGNKIDGLWQRVIYVHIGMVAAVVYLATTEETYMIARMAVLCFYTFNIIITFYNLRDAYQGLQHTIEALKSFDDAPSNGRLAAWVRDRKYNKNASIRAAALGLFWLLVSALILLPVFG